jgi:hypothetical protein
MTGQSLLKKATRRLQVAGIQHHLRQHFPRPHLLGAVPGGAKDR